MRCTGPFLLLILLVVSLGAGWYHFRDNETVASVAESLTAIASTEGLDTLESLKEGTLDQLGAGSGKNTVREWSNSQGKKLNAVLITSDATDCLIRVVPSQRVFRVPIASLSQADRDYISAQADSKQWQMPEPGASKWPASHDWRNLARRYQVSQSEGRLDIGRYRIHCGDADQERIEAITNICLSVDQAIKTVPLPLTWGKYSEGNRKPVFIHSSDAAYVAAGAPEGSAGFYNTRSGEVHINALQMEGLDLRQDIGQFRLAQRKKYTLLTHELVHQSTPAITHSKLPAWVIEGIAEYFSATQHIPGRFDYHHSQKLVEAYFSQNIEDTDGLVQIKNMRLWPLDTLMSRSMRQWNQVSSDSVGKSHAQGIIQYNQALLLVEYFIHGDNNSFKPFLEAALTGVGYEEAVEKHLLRGQSYSQLQEKLTARWASQGVDLIFQGSPAILLKDFQLEVGL